jgi:hypothetical protein
VRHVRVGGPAAIAARRQRRVACGSDALLSLPAIPVSLPSPSRSGPTGGAGRGSASACEPGAVPRLVSSHGRSHRHRRAGRVVDGSGVTRITPNHTDSPRRSAGVAAASAEVHRAAVGCTQGESVAGDGRRRGGCLAPNGVPDVVSRTNGKVVGREGRDDPGSSYRRGEVTPATERGATFPGVPSCGRPGAVEGVFWPAGPSRTSSSARSRRGLLTFPRWSRRLRAERIGAPCPRSGFGRRASATASHGITRSETGHDLRCESCQVPGRGLTPLARSHVMDQRVTALTCRFAP